MIMKYHTKMVYPCLCGGNVEIETKPTPPLMTGKLEIPFQVQFNLQYKLFEWANIHLFYGDLGLPRHCLGVSGHRITGSLSRVPLPNNWVIRWWIQSHDGLTDNVACWVDSPWIRIIRSWILSLCGNQRAFSRSYIHDLASTRVPSKPILNRLTVAATVQPSSASYRVRILCLHWRMPNKKVDCTLDQLI
jgi:hypothetical protein